MSAPLPRHDRVAVVTGASRGAGRAIAAALGGTGATVYVTGRSVPGATTEGLPGSVDETAAEVGARGGTGIAVRCDHTVDAEVEALFERVRDEHGRLDVLVNNVWGGYEGYDVTRFGRPLWE
jgi:NAD(P)-dependent dehydrogenase (short-subunit alcohol dehydrogenase family)